MTTALMFAGLGVLGLLPVAAWWLLRRREAEPVMADDGRAAVAGIEASAPVEIEAGAPGARALLRRLHATAFDKVPPADKKDAADPRDAAVADAAAALLARIDAEPRYIPRRPQLLPQLMRAVHDPRASLDGIARIIGQDPALAGNLLRVANSPLHRVRREPVESLTRAIALLGLDGLRPVIAAALVQPVVGSGEGVFDRLPTLVWEHTQLAAAAASGFARAYGEDDAFAAQLLGLLHGLGAIVVVQVLRDQYARQPGLAADARTIVPVLEEWTVPTARRIAAGWGLTARIGEALEAQRQDAPPTDRLGRALRAGSVPARWRCCAGSGRWRMPRGWRHCRPSQPRMAGWATSRGPGNGWRPEARRSGPRGGVRRRSAASAAPRRIVARSKLRATVAGPARSPARSRHPASPSRAGWG